MEGFVQLTDSECICAVGGKDSSVSALMELLGYGLGRLVRFLRQSGGSGREKYVGPEKGRGLIAF